MANECVRRDTGERMSKSQREMAVLIMGLRALTARLGGQIVISEEEMKRARYGELRIQQTDKGEVEISYSHAAPGPSRIIIPEADNANHP